MSYGIGREGERSGLVRSGTPATVTSIPSTAQQQAAPIQYTTKPIIDPHSGVYYQGEFYPVAVPTGNIITGVTTGTPKIETIMTSEGQKQITTTPLTVSFGLDPLYKAPTPTTQPQAQGFDWGSLLPWNWDWAGAARRLNPFDPSNQPISPQNIIRRENAVIQVAREQNLTIQQARQVVSQQELTKSLVRASVAAGLVTGVIAPVPAVIGAASSVGIQQGLKAVQGGGWLTPEEITISAGLGSTFSVAGGAVMGQAIKAAPILAEHTLRGAITRIGVTTAMGAAGGAGIGGGEAVIYGTDITEGVTRGAMYGVGFALTFAVSGEIFGAVKPIVQRQFTKFRDMLQPERAIYNRVVLQQQAQEAAPTESLGLRVRGALSRQESAMYQRVVAEANAQASTAGVEMPMATPEIKPIKLNWASRIVEYLQPERGLYRRVTTGTKTGEMVTGAKGQGFTSPFESGGGGKPLTFSGGKGLSSVLVVKQASIIKTAMKPLPIQLTAWESMLPKAVQVSAKTKAKTETTVKTMMPAVKIPKAITVNISKIGKVESLKVKTTPTAVELTRGSLIGYDPTQFGGKPFYQRRTRERPVTEETILSYPESGLGHPPILNTKNIDVSAIGLGTSSAVKVRSADFLSLKPKTRSMGATRTSLRSVPVQTIVPSEILGSIADTIQQETTIQVQASSLKELLKQDKTTKYLQGFSGFDLNLGGGGRRDLGGGGLVGRRWRRFPVVTGEQFLENYLSKKKQIHKRKSKK